MQTKLLIVLFLILLCLIAYGVSAVRAAPVTPLRATFTPIATAGSLATPMPTPTDAPGAYPPPAERRAPRPTPNGLTCQRCTWW